MVQICRYKVQCLLHSVINIEAKTGTVYLSVVSGRCHKAYKSETATATNDRSTLIFRQSIRQIASNAQLSVCGFRLVALSSPCGFASNLGPR